MCRGGSHKSFSFTLILAIQNCEKAKKHDDLVAATPTTAELPCQWCARMVAISGRPHPSPPFVYTATRRCLPIARDPICCLAARAQI